MSRFLPVSFCLLAACNAVDSMPDTSALPDPAPTEMPDAAPPPMPDATPPTPPPPDTGVVVRHQEAPVAGVTVVFHDPSGVAIATRSTDAQGRASADVPDRAIISVLGPDPGDLPTLYTFHAVPRGTTVAVNLQNRAPLEIGGFSVGKPASVQQLYVVACPGKGVSGSSEELGVPVHTGCFDSAGRLNVFVMGTPAEEGVGPSGVALPGVTFRPGVELAMPALLPIGQTTFQMTGSLLGPREEPVSVSSDLAVVVGDSRYLIERLNHEGLPATHEGYGIVPGATASSRGLTAFAFRGDASMDTTLTIVGAQAAMPASIDVETALLPFVDNPGVPDNSGITYPEGSTRRPRA